MKEFNMFKNGGIPKSMISGNGEPVMINVGDMISDDDLIKAVHDAINPLSKDFVSSMKMKYGGKILAEPKEEKVLKPSKMYPFRDDECY